MFNFINFRNLTTTTLGILMAGNLIIPSTSAQDSSPNEITLTGTVRDFSDDHPDFERSPGQTSSDGTTFRYGLDTNITTENLGLDQKPVYKGGSYSTTNKSNFDEWYRDISGANQSKDFDITLTKQSNGVYRYENTDFFPINNQMIGNEGRNKNFHFTYELHTRFTYNGGEVFNFRGDDDVWVYINGKKVIDIGGVHSAVTRNVSLDDIADAAGIEVGKNYTLDFFFAERHTTQSNLIIETTLELETAPEVGGNNACILDWSEVLAADSDGWITDAGSNGTRDDLYRVYYHEPSSKYIRVTVDQRWGWGGASGSDSYPYSPKIVDYSKWGTGGFDGEDMFLFSVKPHNDQVNRLTLEFYNDSELTDKADVSHLNFTLTDLDGSSGNKGRENIIVSAENSFGSTVPLEFYRPEGSVIEDVWINGGNVLGKPKGIKGPEGNIAPVLLGDTHKVEIAYQLAPGSGESNGIRHMYVSDLAWCGEVVNVTPDEEVDIDEVINSDDDDNTPSTDDSDGNGIPDVNENNPTEDADDDGVDNVEDPDDDGNGIPDIDEIGDPTSPTDTDGDDIPDYQDPDDDNDGIPDDEELYEDPDPDFDGIPSHQDLDSDNNGILDKNEMLGTSSGEVYPENPSNYDRDNDGTPDYLDLDDDNDGIADVFELYPLSQLDLGNISAEENNGLPYPPANGLSPESIEQSFGDNAPNFDSSTEDNFEPDYHDLDSDGDGIADELEGSITTLGGAPRNSDKLDTDSQLNYPNYDDHKPDFQDTDSDDNGKLDNEEVEIEGEYITRTISGTSNIPDFQNLDDDGDGIADIIEIGANPASPINSDESLTKNSNYDKPDYQDTDSDNDGILDVNEAFPNTQSNETGKTITVTSPSGEFTFVNLKDSNNDGVILPGTAVVGTPTIKMDGTYGSVDKFDYQTGTFAD